MHKFNFSLVHLHILNFVVYLRGIGYEAPWEPFESVELGLATITIGKYSLLLRI